MFKLSTSSKFPKLLPLTVLILLAGCDNLIGKTTAEQSLNTAQELSSQFAQQVTGQTAQTSAFSFAKPVNCTLGQDCFILLYPDRDPGPAAVDFGCGRQTYDGHNGTDFAIPDEYAMQQGVQVLAAAGGQVLRVRDGVPDRRIQGETDKAQIEGTECGNGMVIDHGNGWETQYCHLRQGSVVVKPGDTVAQGAVLGKVGASGLASFPHVHLSIRYQGESVDPFVGPNAGAGCQVSPNPIWQTPLPYTPTGLIRAGFSPAPPNMNALWEGKHRDQAMAVNSEALVFWIFSYGILAGDEEHYQVFSPQGEKIVDNRNVIKEPSRTWMGYVGKRNTPQRPLTPGIWQAQYRLTRGNKVLIDVKREIQLYN